MFVSTVAALLIAATDAEQATTFIRKTLESFTRDAPDPAHGAYADSLRALMDRDQKGAEGIGVLDSDPICDCQDWDTVVVKSVKAGEKAEQFITVVATFTNGDATTTTRFIVEVNKQGPRIWDIYRNAKEASIRVALETAIEERELRAASVKDAVKLIRGELDLLVHPSVNAKRVTYAPSLDALMLVDSALTDGVPYVNADIVCNCQDNENSSIESVKAAGKKGKMVRVVADFHVAPGKENAQHLTYTLIQTPKGLALYDVEDKNGSLRKHLAEAIAKGYQGVR